MAKMPKEHTKLYFDVLCRTKKAQVIFSLIQATYHAWNLYSTEAEAKAELRVRLKECYKLFRGDAGSYEGTTSQWQSQYTIGLEMCIWKDSSYRLTELAKKVATLEISTQKYFDIIFLNYFQPISGKNIHPLYSLLSYLYKNKLLEIDKASIPSILGVDADSEEVNSLCNYMLGTSFFDYTGRKLIYVSKEDIADVIKRCNLKYISPEGYEQAKKDLEKEENYVSYISSIREEETSFLSSDTKKELFENWLTNYAKKPNGDPYKYNYITHCVYALERYSKIIHKDIFQLNDLDSVLKFQEETLINEDCISFDKSGKGTAHNAVVLYIKFFTLFFTKHNETKYYVYPSHDEVLNSEFADTDVLYVAQDAKKVFRIGDIIYIYSKERITFKCIVESIDLEQPKDEKWICFEVIDGASVLYAKTRILGIISDNRTDFLNLALHGLVKKPDEILELDDQFIQIKQYLSNIFDLELKEIVIQGERKLSSENPNPLNLILYGPPGTGKTYSSMEYANAIIEGRLPSFDNLNETNRLKTKQTYDKYFNEKQIAFVTFHQSYSYEDFVEGFFAEEPKEGNLIPSFKVKPGIFKRMAELAYEHPEKYYVLIIDEINRGNISKIFGELITLIERDKRYGEENTIYANLPYSPDPFCVPNNLYILGTMNTADKSISLIDAALRRRFQFHYVGPNLSLLNGEPELKDILEKINKFLHDSPSVGSDLLIGHAYFLGKKLKDLPEIMNNSIIPLLYEYFCDNKNSVSNCIECVKSYGFKIIDDMDRLKIE